MLILGFLRIRFAAVDAAQVVVQPRQFQADVSRGVLIV